jgi:DNA-binding LacI/PurR family transcriptional regulator
MGYRPNPSIAALMTHLRTGRSPADGDLLALVMFHDSRRELQHYPFTRHLLEGIDSRAAELGYHVEDFPVGARRMSLRRLDEVLHCRSIRGVILPPTPTARSHVLLHFDRYVMIAAGHSLWRPDLSRVTTNHEFAVATALRELRRRGYDRVGLAVHASNDVRVERRWSGGFLSHASQDHAKSVAPLLVAPEWTPEVLCRWIRREKLRAVISPHIEALEWMRAGGIACPESSAFVCLDWSSSMDGVCAGVNQRGDVIGRVLVSTLVSQLERNETGLPSHPLHIAVKGDWHDGPTAPPLARRKASSPAGVSRGENSEEAR